MFAVALVLGSVSILATLLAFVRHKAWWIRIWDFPRLQVTLVGLVALAFWALDRSWTSGWRLAFGLAVAAAIVRQLALIWRYTRLSPREVQETRLAEPERRLSLVVTNVLQTNRGTERLLAEVRGADPDVILAVETNAWWQERLDVLRATHPHAVPCPLENTYGMLLYSRLPLEDVRVEFLVQHDVPSIQAMLRLRNGQRVWLNCVHPRPPAPGESDDSLPRDAELILVGKRVADADVPVIVCGDLNDVAWSHTTRLFQRISGLVDPRKGRGFYSTFHARWPGLRYPLDHVFHSRDFRLVRLRTLGDVGSDHFPVYVELSHEPAAQAGQAAPHADSADEREAAETVGEARGRAAGDRGTGAGRN